MRPDRDLATSGCGARARCSGRCPPAAPTARPRRHRAALRRAALPHAGRPRAARADAARRARRRRRRPTSRSCSPPAASRSQWHTMTRTGKSQDLLGRRAASRSSSCTPTTPSAPASSDGERVRVRSRRGARDAARAASPTPCRRGRRVRAVPLGRAAPRAGRGRAQRGASRARSTRSRCRRAQGERRARRAGPRRRAPRRSGRRGGSWSSAAAWRGWRRSRRCSRTTTRRWEVTIVGREPDAPYNRVLLSQALAGDVGGRRGSRSRAGSRPRRDAAPRRRGARRSTRARATVELADGEALAYDELVLATGSRAVRAAGARRSTAGRPRRSARCADTRAIRGRGGERAARRRHRRRPARPRGGARAARARRAT